MKKTVALVLGSGGARGYTHIGVIEELNRRGYDVVSVSGCSMGAVVGGFYCAGKLDMFTEWSRSLSYMDVIRLIDLSFISSGAIRGDRLFNLLADMLEDINIEDLPLPFTAVATDLVSSKEVWFQDGSLEKAMRASAAIPSLIQPVEQSGKVYVDGGVLNPLPIAPSVSAHADYIIAVDLNTDAPMPDDCMYLPVDCPPPGGVLPEEGNAKQAWFDTVMAKAGRWLGNADESENGDHHKPVNANLGKLEILYQMFEVMQASLSQYKVAGYPPDLLVRVPNNCCQPYEFYRANEMIELGRYIAVQALDAFEQGHSSLYGQRLG